MIATVAFLTEVPVFKGVLVGDVGSAAIRERARQILVWTRAGFENVEFVGGKRRRAQEGAEEVSQSGRIQGGC